MRRPVSVGGRSLTLVARRVLFVLFAASVVGWWLSIGTPDEADFGTRLAPTLSGLAGVVFVLVGTMFVSRRPRRAGILIGLITELSQVACAALQPAHFSLWLSEQP